MKAKMKEEIFVNAWVSDREEKDALRLPSGAAISFNIEDILQDGMEAAWDKWHFWIGHMVITASEPESIEDTVFLLDIQKELESGKNVCCVSFFRDNVEFGYYIFSDEELPPLSCNHQEWQKRQVFYKLAKELVTDGYTLEECWKGGPHIFSRVQGGKKTVIKEFSKTMDGLNFFKSI